MIKKINIEKIIFIIVLLVMVLIPILKFTTYIPTIEKFYINTFEIKRVYVLWVALLLLLFTYLYLIFSKKEKIGIADVIILVLIGLAFLSTNYALDFEKSFFGEQYRYDGLLTILCYYFLVLNVKSIKQENYKKIIVKLFLSIGIFQSMYGVLQSYTDFNFIRHHSSGHMAMGLCSNPNFFGSYMVMQVLIIGFMYVYNPKWKYLIIYILFSIALYLAESTGPALSVVLTLIFSFFICRKKAKNIIKLIIILLLSFGFTYISLDFVQKNKFNKEIFGANDIISDITTITNTSAEKFGSGRMTVWENSIPLIKKYWLIGCGLDNFKDAYPNSGYYIYDKAHNVYLQIAITNGIPALLLFLILLFICFIKGFKLKNRLFTPMYMAFIGYSVQAFLNISVIDVAPYYFIILGLLNSFVEDGKRNDKYLIS